MVSLQVSASCQQFWSSKHRGTGVSQFAHYIRKIKTLHFPALILTLAALVARGDISGSSSGHLSSKHLGTGVSQFGHYVRKIKTLQFPALIPTSAATVARGDICCSMKELVVPDRRCSHLDFLKLTLMLFSISRGGEGGGRK